jgi:hypothetical protein
VTGKLIREDEDEHQPRRQRQGWMKRLDLRGTGLDQIACLALRGRGPAAINFLDCRSRSRCRHVLNRSPLFLPAPGGRGPAAITFSASNPRRQSHCRPGEILSPPPSSFCRSPVSSSRQGGAANLRGSWRIRCAARSSKTRLEAQFALFGAAYSSYAEITKVPARTENRRKYDTGTFYLSPPDQPR